MVKGLLGSRNQTVLPEMKFGGLRMVDGVPWSQVHSTPFGDNVSAFPFLVPGQ